MQKLQKYWVHIVAVEMILSLLLLAIALTPKPKVQQASPNPPRGVIIYASRPETMPSISTEIGEKDARADIVKLYLQKYDSPMKDYYQEIVSEADKEGIDFRLIPAIAQQESNLCKFIPKDSYNCWGWGINSASNLGFSSYEEGIRVVTEGLKRDYIGKGLTTPEQIMAKYTPLSDGSWAKGVSQFMDDLQ